jgi:Ceramidase
MNTYSAFGMLLVAVVFWQRARRASWPALFNGLYFAALFLLWFGTVFLHATLTEAGQWTDGVGLYAVILFVLVYFVALRFRWPKSRFALIYLVTLGACAAFAWNFMQFRVLLFGLLVSLTFLLILWLRRWIKFRTRDLLLAGSFFLVGLVFQILDRKLILCSRFSIWQGHALWHILSAVATYFLGTLMLNARYEPSAQKSRHVSEE